MIWSKSIVCRQSKCLIHRRQNMHKQVYTIWASIYQSHHSLDAAGLFGTVPFCSLRQKQARKPKQTLNISLYSLISMHQSLMTWLKQTTHHKHNKTLYPSKLYQNTEAEWISSPFEVFHLTLNTSHDTNTINIMNLASIWISFKRKNQGACEFAVCVHPSLRSCGINLVAII